MVTDVEDETVNVVTANVALEFPAATVTEEGTVAADVLLLDKDIVTPPAGAALLRVTVPVEPAPPDTDVGLRLTELNATAWVTVRGAVWLVPL
jgi:hypothetical protein